MDLLNVYDDYLLLNASFQNNIGMFDGKIPVVLHFANSNTEHRRSIAFSFLEEIQMQINLHTPIGFGNGIAGYGAVLEYLSHQKLITDDISELLEEPERHILNYIYNGSNSEPGLYSGTSGLGLYLIARINSRTPSNSSFQQLRLKEALIACIDQLEIAWENSIRQGKRAMDISLWSGWTGVLLFLEEAKETGIYNPEVSILEEKITEGVLKVLYACKDNWQWEFVNCWFVIFQTFHKKDSKLSQELSKFFSKQIRRQFSFVKIIPAEKRMWYSLMLHLMGQEYDIEDASKLARSILKETIASLNSDFSSPFSKADSSNEVNTGLVNGICGTVLPLQAITSNSYEWLSILGIHVKKTPLFS